MDREIVWFDLETTGTSTSKDRIVSISAIKTLNGEIVEKKYTLVNPCMIIPEEATKVHGITNEMVLNAPSFSRLAKSIHVFFAGCILGGYNVVKFDIPLLQEEFFRVGLSLEIGDIIDCCDIFHKKEKRDLSAALLFYTGKTMEGAHNAEFDNMATIEIFEGQKAKYGELPFYERTSLDLAGKIDLEGRYTFGPHKGKKVIEEVGFARWMLPDIMDFTTDTKNVVRKLIEGK